jgi:hypothetical protein
MADGKGFNCCGDKPRAGTEEVEDCGCGASQTGDQAAECIVQDMEERIIPCGTRKMAGQMRQYKTTTGAWFSRMGFMNWSKKQGYELDPICWFTEMGHGPVPADENVEL